MKELLEFIISNSLPEGTTFDIRQSENEAGITFEIEIPEELRGKIIGKAGSNIKSIRDVLNILAYKHQKRVFLKLVD